jgi:hypothetical protein
MGTLFLYLGTLPGHLKLFKNITFDITREHWGILPAYYQYKARRVGDGVTFAGGVFLCSGLW